MLEIRGHARGGQGMVTAFEILAKVFNQLDTFQVQAFPAFGVERTGAPIQAFLRVGKDEILNRSNIYHPHLIVVFDESLIGQVPVFDGLEKEGAILLNTARPPEDFSQLERRIYTVPATQISLGLGLGSKSLPIVNAAMIGAIAHVFEVPLSLVQDAIRENVPAKPDANAESAAQAYSALNGPGERNRFLIDALQAPLSDAIRQVEDLYFEEVQAPKGLEAPVWSSPLSANKTGNWRLLTPAYVERTPPCNSNCPAGTDVRAFVQLAGERKFDEAYKTIYAHNPFPAICGRACPHFCEQTCNRNSLDRGLNIGAIERFLGERELYRPVEPAEVRYPERIAVIGAGPAGLTAALRLCEAGYATTVYDALPYAGGMMRSGIPKFRLPDEILSWEVERIQQKGVRIVLNRRVEVDELDGDYDIIVAATGSHLGHKLGIEGEELALEGLSFLREFKLNGRKNGLRKGSQVAIIGGGNTAIDVARTVLRLGGEPTIYYRRSMKEMPAIAHEVKEALLEGVNFEFLTAPIKLADAGYQTQALALQKMQLGEPDESGRRRPEPVSGTERTVLVDHVIAATGQYSDPYVFGKQMVEARQGRIAFPAKTPIFCAGDMAWGGTVTEAIGSGNRVAKDVHALLRGLPCEPEKKQAAVVGPDDINYEYYLPAPRHYNKHYRPRDFYGDFREVSKGLDAAEVVAETARCLHCGDCYSCGNCYNFCPDAAIHVDEEGRLRIDYDYCKGCGICVQECPCSAMQFKLTEAES